jgi:hypothetical protein
MKKWFTTTILAAALACTGVTSQAQQPAGQLPPAPPADAPQPANDGDADAAPEQAGAAAAEAAEVDARRQMEIELHNLAQGQRALAVARLQQGDAVGGMAQFRLAKGKTEKAAWLGVSTSKVPPALRHHAKLKNKYVGLVVERVEPGSPAEEAGLEQFDIIEKVGDQWIVNTEQFSVVLRMNEPGKEVDLSIIREGQPQQLKVKLAEKELPVLGQNMEWNVVAPAVAAAEGFRWGQGNVIIRDGELEPLILNRLRDAENFQKTVRDDEHTLKVSVKKGKRHLVASDANGVVIYDGPINTEEEIGNVPEEIREKVEKLDDMPGIDTTKATKKTPATAPANERE